MSLRLVQPHDDPPKTIDFAAEADHRIANHLAMINSICRLQASALRRRGETLTGAEAGEVLDGVAAKVEAISLLHRHLARLENEELPRLGEYLRGVLDRITEAMGDRNAISFELLGDSDRRVSAGTAASVGIITCELVTNAMKHAHPTGIGGRVDVRCRAGAQIVMIEVEDDGVGLPEAFEPEAAQGLGFRSMYGLASQLGATLMFRNSGLGLLAELRIPVDATP